MSSVCCVLVVFCFFFKQKTAYEMRISDWSSDVCSSDLQGITVFLVPMDAPGIEVRPIPCMLGPHHLNEVFLDDVWVTEADVLGTVDEGWKVEIGRASCRERVCQYV